jgi:hypothetical protein
LFPLCVAQFFPFSLLSSSEQGSEAACSVTGLLLGLQFSLPKDALVFRFVSCPVKNLLASAVSCYAKFFFFALLAWTGFSCSFSNPTQAVLLLLPGPWILLVPQKDFLHR